jgi:PAS domain S-box-containing protein
MSNNFQSTDFLNGGGQMAAVVLAKDWSTTPLGPIQAWPPSLRTTVSLCLASNFPLSIAWGPHRILIYNDGYWPICGAKHPDSMGQDFKECWLSAWPEIGPAFERAQAGDTSFLENQRMFLDRNGYLEETFFTFSFSPIRDETGHIGGLFHPVMETTARMLSERRTRALRDLTTRTARVCSVNEAAEAAMQVLADCSFDIPFALFYALDAEGKTATLAGAVGVEPGGSFSPVSLQAHDPANLWPLQKALTSGDEQIVDNLASLLAGPCGPYPEIPSQALVLPIPLPGLNRFAGVLIAGVSSRLPLDEAYQSFYDLLVSQISAAMANAHAYAEERRRAEMLAELDRAKTAFFSNVSHEFRTPLTLMLGPLDDILGTGGERLSVDRADLDVVYRNGLRLLRLVNSLLEFSRFEAGRVDAYYEPTDLAVLTVDLAGNFRSAIEKAGLRFVVNCPPLSRPVYVDHDMWGTVVLNLLSNAFKFTLEGEVRVSLRETGRGAELEITDTGIGIPAHEMPRLFERFHRVETSHGRTHEGTGIGLSLLQEFVKLHGGSVTVESEPGCGSAFKVLIPFGSSHLPPEKVRENRAAGLVTGAEISHTRAFVEEALQWLPQEEGKQEDGPGPDRTRPHVVIADDNADMRTYVQKLLAESYDVVAVANGVQALEAVSQRLPDLVVSDVMMPEMDGFALLAKLRASRATEHIPVILLSARAGEEARVAGLESGADDYLVKPFSARELFARVRTSLELAQLRRKLKRESQAQLQMLAESNVIGLFTWDLTGRILWANAAFLSMLGYDAAQIEAGTLNWFALTPEASTEARERAMETLRQSRRIDPFEHALRHRNGSPVPVLMGGALYEENAGTAFLLDLSELHDREEALRKSETRLRESEERYRSLTEATTQIVWLADASGAVVKPLPSWQEFTDQSWEAYRGWGWLAAVHPDDREQVMATWTQARTERSVYECEYRLKHRPGGYRYMVARAVAIADAHGEVAEWIGTNTDITRRKQQEEEIRALNDRLQRAMTETHHRVKNSLQMIAALVDIQLMDDAQFLPAEDFRKLSSQVRTLAAVHEVLTEMAKKDGQATHVSSRHLLKVLLPLLQQMVGGRALRTHVDDIWLSTHAGTSLALVTTELVTNAAKHAGSMIAVTLKAEDEAVVLTVEDDGTGFSEGFDVNEVESTGLGLVEQLSRFDLRGFVGYGNRKGGGACVTVTFPHPLTPDL